MQIKRLKLSGFKSFVDPTELRVERGLTGIVGPNGCGKSNLLEAIRWVMGEGSAKSLRGGAMDDVIFAGTQARPSRDFAEVSILAEGMAANDGSDIGHDVEVVRRIERGAGSAYRVNGRDVRAKDVALVFADAATGAHSPALVSQGRIGAIIAAKPAERRAMLEEAAGISGLHVRRKDAEQKLRATETNLGRLDEVLADMEVRSASLRRQAKSAERYRRLSEEIRIAEGRLIYARWREAADAADKAKAEAMAAEAKVAQAGETHRQAIAAQAEAVSLLAGLRAAALAERDKASEAGHRLAALAAERSGLERRIADLASQTRRLAEDREREGQLARDAADALSRLDQETRHLAARVSQAEGLRPALAERLGAAEAKVRDAEVELAQALATQAREQAETRVAEAAVAASSARLARAAGECAQIDAVLRSLGEAAPLSEALLKAQAARTDAEARAAAAEAAISGWEQARARAVGRRDAAESALASAQASLSALEAEARALVKALEAAGATSRALDRVRAAPGFERALAAALGDDLEAGIGPEGRRGWRGAETRPADPPLPAGCRSLADHVQAPDELKRRLAQIAVVDSDSGQPLAVGQRLVTRDGRVRRWDGFASDGDGAAAADRLEKVNRLSRLETDIGPARLAVEEARSSFHSGQQEAEAARTAAEAARAALGTAESEMRAARRAEDEAASALERLSSRREELSARLARAEGERQEAAAELSAAEASRAGITDGSATAQLVARLQAGCEAARAAVAGVGAERTTVETGIAADRERLSAARSEAQGWRSRAGEAARRIAEMDARAREAEVEAASLEGAPERMGSRIEALERECADLARAADLAAKAERDAEAALRGLDAQVQVCGETLASAREARAGAVARAESQELRRIEMGRVSGERFECPPPLLPERVGFDSADVEEAMAESARHDRLVLDRERLGPVNLVAEQELAEIEETRSVSLKERDELAEAINRLRGSIGSLNREGRARLLSAFEAVNGHFQRLFMTLFNGGQAHLALIDSDDPLEAGLEIFAQPPGKRLQSLTLLSGGEQALTAVALIFALFLTNPAPICVLDEVDAPLDDANIERFCDLLDAMTRETDTRYLIVTHNAVTMSRMHRLFGVTMIEKGVSRLVSVDLGGAEQLLAAE